MLRAFVLYLLELLKESLDPELKARVEVARGKAAALEIERVRLLADVAEGERVNAELGKQRLVNALEREKLEEAIKQSEADLAAKNTAVLARPDDDIERPLPL